MEGVRLVFHVVPPAESVLLAWLSLDKSPDHGLVLERSWKLRGKLPSEEVCEQLAQLSLSTIPFTPFQLVFSETHLLCVSVREGEPFSYCYLKLLFSELFSYCKAVTVQPRKAAALRDVERIHTELRHRAAECPCLCSAEQGHLSAKKGQLVGGAQGARWKQSQTATPGCGQSKCNVKTLQGWLKADSSWELRNRASLLESVSLNHHVRAQQNSRFKEMARE